MDKSKNLEELWKPVKGFEGLYEISNTGLCRSYHRKEKVLKAYPCRGYLSISLYKDAKRRNRQIHRLVAEEFIPREDMSLIVDHINRNKQSNDMVNLHWVTPSQNQKNTGLRSTNKTGHKNIYWSESGKTYVIDTRTNGIRKTTKRKKLEDAIMVRDHFDAQLKLIFLETKKSLTNQVVIQSIQSLQ